MKRHPLVEECVRQGWRLVRNRTHVVLKSTAGKVVVLAATPSHGRGSRAWLNELATLRRNGLVWPPSRAATDLNKGRPVHHVSPEAIT